MAVSNVQLKVDATQAVQALRQVNRASGQADTATQQLTRSTHGTTAALNRQARAAQGATNAIRSLASGLVSIGATALVAGMVRGAASAEQLQLRLKMLSKEYGETARLQQFVAQSAATFGQSQVEAAQGVADVYARLRPLGISLTQIETVYKGFNAVALASGTTSQAASDAFLQLSQALGSGTLQGDEFRSVAEQVPGILRLVANEMGVTVGQLKKLGSEGKITSDILINALAVGFEENGSKIKELLDQSPAQRFKEFQNATQALSNALGSELLPALTPIVSAATELLKQFGSLPGPIKTITAAVVGLTAAFIALAPAISAVKGLMAGLTLSGLLAAGPWVALAAGITTATVALAGYRSEAQKIGAAARGGGAAELATARTRLSNVGQDISLLERQQRDATGRERGSIDRRLAVLRAEQRQLRADVQAGAAVGGAAPSSTAAVTAAAGGGRAGGGRAAAAAKAIKDITAQELELRLRLGMAQQSQNKAQEAYYTRQLALLDISQQEIGPNQRKALIYEATLRYAEAMKRINEEEARITLPTIVDRIADMASGFRKVIDLAPQLTEQQKQQQALADGIANTVGDGMASAFNALVQGTEDFNTSLRRIASGVLTDIANQLLRVFVIQKAINAISNLFGATPASPLSKVSFNPAAFTMPSLLTPRAMGGSVTGGRPYLVGEKGPELFMPGRSGGIAPTGSFGGGINVVVNVDASGTSVAGNEPDAAQLGRAVSVAVQAEIIKQQRPGGLLSTTRR